MGISYINCNMDLTFLSSFIIRHKFPGGQNRVPFKGALMTSPSSQACWIWGLGCGWNEVPSQKGKGSASMCVPSVPDVPDPSPRWSWLVPKLLPFLWVHLSIPNTVFTGFWLNCVHVTWWHEIVNLMFKASLPMRNTIWKRRKWNKIEGLGSSGVGGREMLVYQVARGGHVLQVWKSPGLCSSQRESCPR